MKIIYIKMLSIFIISSGITFVAIPIFIKVMNHYRLFSRAKELNLDYSNKTTVPSIGGLILILATLIPFVCISNFNHLSAIITLTLGSFAILGFLDDYSKLKRLDLSDFKKLIAQMLIFTLIYYLLIKDMEPSLYILNKCFKVNKLFYFIFSFIVIIGSSNAFNITDGLDGLSTLNSLGVFIFILLASFKEYSFNENINYINVIFFSTSCIGSLIAFLWYNCYPASIYMGDTGSLAYGAIAGLLFVIIKKEVYLITSGIFFLIEILSVIIQRTSIKLFKKRLLKISPIHHHYEAKGVHENKIVIRSFILSFFFLSISIFTLFFY